MLVIGAGFSGINMAIKLKQMGIKFRLVEKEPRLGGTWWQNQYPGAGCEVSAHIYRYTLCTLITWTKNAWSKLGHRSVISLFGEALTILVIS